MIQASPVPASQNIDITASRDVQLLQATDSQTTSNTSQSSITAGTDSQYQGVGQGNITTQGADLLAKGDVSLAAGAAAGALNEKLIPLMVDYLEKNGVTMAMQAPKLNNQCLGKMGHKYLVQLFGRGLERSGLILKTPILGSGPAKFTIRMSIT